MLLFFFSSRRRHTIFDCDWSSDVCSSDLHAGAGGQVSVLFVGDVVGGIGRRTLLESLPILRERYRPTFVRSEEGRVGEECRSRWSPDHLKKKRVIIATGVSDMYMHHIYEI